MNPPPRIVSGVSLIILLGTGVFLAGVNRARWQRVEYVTGLAQPATPVGHGTTDQPHLRNLIVPERNEATFELIAIRRQRRRI